MRLGVGVGVRVRARVGGRVRVRVRFMDIANRLGCLAAAAVGSGSCWRAGFFVRASRARTPTALKICCVDALHMLLVPHKHGRTVQSAAAGASVTGRLALSEHSSASLCQPKHACCRTRHRIVCRRVVICAPATPFSPVFRCAWEELPRDRCLERGHSGGCHRDLPCSCWGQNHRHRRQPSA